MTQDKETIKSEMEKMFSEGVLKRFDANRFLFMITEEISDAVDEGLDWNFDNSNSTVGKFMQNTTQSLGDIGSDVKIIRKDTKSLVESMEKLEKLLKRTTLGGGGSGNFFDDFMDKKNLKQWKDRAVKVGTKFYRNPTIIKFVRGLEKTAKFSKYAGIAATVILEASEPVFAYAEGQPPEVVRREIVGAIANILGTIIGMKIGAVAGGAVGTAFGGVGAVPGAVVGILLGGAIGYLTGEGLEALAENIWDTIIEGRNIEDTINAFAKKQATEKRAKSKNITQYAAGRGARAGELKKQNWNSTTTGGRGTKRNQTQPLISIPQTTEKTDRLSTTNQSVGFPVNNNASVMTQKSQPQSQIILPGGETIPIGINPYNLYNERVGGIEDGTGKYLIDQRDQMPSMFGGAGGRFDGRTPGMGVNYGSGSYGEGGGAVLTPEISEKDKILWDSLSSGKTVVSSSTLAKFTDENLQQLGINKNVQYGGDRHMSATTYSMSVSDSEIKKNLFSGSAYKNAILAGMASGEGGDDYGAINYKAGGGSTKDFSKHPFLGKKGFTAAGRYQILASNYAKYGKKLGITDFSRESQDKIAWEFASDVYKRQTGRSLDEDAKNPDNHSKIFQALSSDWHGLRGGGLKKAMDWSQKEIKKQTMTEDEYKKLSPEKQAELKQQAIQRINDSKKDSFSQIAYGVNGAAANSSLISGNGLVTEDQQKIARTRKGRIQSKLKSDMEKVAAKNGVNIRVTSGGQRMEGAPGAVGDTHNHDQGFAGDIEITMKDENGKDVILNSNNPAHREKLAQITQDFAHLGHSVGLGYNYMEGNKMHVGSGPHGSQRLWGDGESIKGAPDWVKTAYYAGTKLKNTPFGNFESPTIQSPSIPSMITTIPTPKASIPAGPVIDAAYIDMRIKQATGELINKVNNLETKNQDIPTISKTGRLETDKKGGPDPARFGGDQSTKPASFHENNARQKVPDWAFNPYISPVYMPAPTPE